MTNALHVVLSSEEIKNRVEAMGKQLTQNLQGTQPVAICILSSSFIFYSDLIRHIDLEMSCEFLGVSSYKDKNVSSGEVNITLDLAAPLEGKDVILIEDLVDSGLTMNYLIHSLKARRPKSLTVVCLLLKPGALKIPCKPDLVGFEIPNDYVVGYGMDSAGLHRNLPYVARLNT